VARAAGFEPAPHIGGVLSSLGDWCAAITLCPIKIENHFKSISKIMPIYINLSILLFSKL
jgi:hypothetical protein